MRFPAHQPSTPSRSKSLRPVHASRTRSALLLAALLPFLSSGCMMLAAIAVRTGGFVVDDFTPLSDALTDGQTQVTKHRDPPRQTLSPDTIRVETGDVVVQALGSFRLNSTHPVTIHRRGDGDVVLPVVITNNGDDVPIGEFVAELGRGNKFRPFAIWKVEVEQDNREKTVLGRTKGKWEAVVRVEPHTATALYLNFPYTMARAKRARLQITLLHGVTKMRYVYQFGYVFDFNI